jgi:hypothetical protein
VLARTLIQQRVPHRVHGRAFAAYNGMRNGAELVALAGGGVLVAAIGGRATLALAGAIPVAAAAIGLVLFAGVQTPAPAAEPDAAPRPEPDDVGLAAAETAPAARDLADPRARG